MFKIESKNIFIIAAGPSAKGFPFHELIGKGFVLGVNDAGLLVEADGILSMDRLWFEGRWNQCRIKDKPTLLRHTVYDRIFVGKKPAKGFPEIPWVKLHRVVMEYSQTNLSLTEGLIHGRNSGFCAYNWAVHQKPENIFLIGFDMQVGKERKRWYRDYEWDSKKKSDRYRAWAQDFDVSKPVTDSLGINVYNLSQRSRIQAFRKVTLEQALLLAGWGGYD